MEEWIKKSDAIKAVNRAKAEGMTECPTYYLGTVPSADRPRGELKYMGTYYKCSVCGSEFNDEITFMGELNYCPACGADIRGVDDE